VLTALVQATHSRRHHDPWRKAMLRYRGNKMIVYVVRIYNACYGGLPVKRSVLEASKKARLNAKAVTVVAGFGRNNGSERTSPMPFLAMRRTTARFFAASGRARFHASSSLSADPVVRIANGTFYRQHPSSRPAPGQDAPPNPPLFPHLTVSLPSFSAPNQHWAVLSPSSDIRTAFLQILRGQLLCFPPTARTYPYLLSPEIAQKDPKLRYPEQAIEYVGFDVERKAFGGAYLSARYESLKEDTDFTLKRYLTGIVTLNPGEEELKAKTLNEEVTRQVMKELELERFLDKPVSMLSNGQSRRARIGKALLTRPEVLCLDAPFSMFELLRNQVRELTASSWSRSNRDKAHIASPASPCRSQVS
jgi:ABC-type sugar transport system ATPase subunit